MRDPVAWLIAQLNVDEWWAREASRLRGQREAVGDHWQWEETDNDRVLLLDPTRYEYVSGEYGGCEVSLRSREEYPTIAGELANFAISTAEDVPTTAAGHIVRHDPARVLAEVAAKRRIIQRHPGATDTDECPGCGANLDGTWRTGPGEKCPELLDVAAPYADLPGFPEELKQP